MSEQGIDRQIALLQLKAKRSLEAARRHIENGDYDFASSRAYYAAFYAIESLLLANSLSFSKHSGVIAAFNQHFIKTGVFPKEFSTYIARLFRQRQIGEYEVELIIDRNDALDDAQIAEKVVAAIAAYLVSINAEQTEASVENTSATGEPRDEI